MFIAALFTIAKTWKQRECPLTDEWMKKMRGMSIMEYFSAIKRNEVMPFAAAWIDLEMILLREINQKEKVRYHMLSLTYGTSTEADSQM